MICTQWIVRPVCRCETPGAAEPTPFSCVGKRAEDPPNAYSTINLLYVLYVKYISTLRMGRPSRWTDPETASRL
jgi:hypothetical protein